jgi:thiol:disulfide interchange protein
MRLQGWLSAMVLCVSAGIVAAAENPFTATMTFEPAAAGTGKVVVEMTVPADHYLYDDMLAVSAEPPVVLAPLDKPEPEVHFDAVTATNRAVYPRPFRMSFQSTGVMASGLTVSVSFQGCAGDLCYLPLTRTFSLPAAGGAGVEMAEPDDTAASPPSGGTAAGSAFRVKAKTEGYLKTDAFLSFLTGQGPAAGGGQSSWVRLITGGGIIGILIILLGGLLLNLTPCVLPMIPINLAIIGAGSKAGSHLRGLLLGSLYGLGMAGAYGLLGIIVVLTGAVFGTLNASPWFNLAFAVLFIVLALAMFGVFNLDLTRFQPSSLPDGRKRGGAAAFFVAFFLGALSALLAGACVAPVVVAVLAHASDLYAAGSRAGLLLPLVLGLGMALPWPFAGAGMAVLPKPGRWMLWVKGGMGVVILLLALNYAWNAWNGFRWHRTPTDSRAALATALERASSSGKPVFIDFWATWCKSCRTMDETTFRQDSVKKALEGFEVVKFQAERPNDPEIKAILDQYGVKGLPSYVILEAR